MNLTNDAHDTIVETMQATEQEMAEGGALYTLRDWGSKYVGAIVRIAGLLHLAQYGANGARHPIDAHEILKAVRVGTYFKLHAIKAFTAMGTDETISNMIYALDRIIRTAEPVLSERDIHRETRSRFDTVARLRPVIANLVERGFLLHLPEPEPKGPGRPPSPRFAVHPDASQYPAEP
jgi:hypothetical protein